MLTQHIEDFEFDYYDPKQQSISHGSSTAWEHQWTILFFYPADFTSVCPTELEDLSQYQSSFEHLNKIQLYVISTDSVDSHRQRVTTTDSLSQFTYPMISDKTHHISQYFWVYNEQTWNARRATIILNPHKVIVSYEMVIDEIGRWTKELIRRLAALQQNFNHKETLCPSSREPGKDTIINPQGSAFQLEDFFL